MRKYYNVEFNKGPEILKEYFMDDPRYEISEYITRWTKDSLEDLKNPGWLWDNILDSTFFINSVLYIDLS